MAFSTSNGAAGEGGIFVLSGTASAASPLLVANFKDPPGRVAIGPDGKPCNVYTVKNLSTDSSYIAAFRVLGLQGSGETSSNYVTVSAGEKENLQIGNLSNGLTYVQAWLLTSTGVTAGSGSIYCSGQVISRRES